MDRFLFSLDKEFAVKFVFVSVLKKKKINKEADL